MKDQSPDYCAHCEREFNRQRAMTPQRYTYRGDRWTAESLKGQTCEAVRNVRGKCIRGKNGNMLVRFTSGALVVVLGRQLRKVA